MSFWTDGKLEPKRQNRWVVQFDGIYNGNMFFANKVGRPSIEVSNKEHKFLNHTFNYPGRATWKPISLTMVDTAGGGTDAGINTMGQLLQILTDSGYVVPGNEARLGTIAKNKAVTTLSSNSTAAAGAGSQRLNSNGVLVYMVDADGNTIEKWNLKNAFITKFTPSELSYEDDGIATVDIEITYDYCEFSSGDDAATFFKPVT